MTQYFGKLKEGANLSDVVKCVKLNCSDCAFDVEEKENGFFVNVTNSHPSYKVGEEFRHRPEIEKFLCIAI